MIGNGSVNVADRSPFGGILLGAIASNPQVKAPIFIDSAHQLFGASIGKAGPALYTADYTSDGAVRRAVVAARSA